jgi:diketogulonate reductase-like aldo/keto reductase
MPVETLRTVTLPAGDVIPVLGQGTWHMAEDPACRDEEIAALRLGLDLGMTVIDTAELYADGGSEELVAEAITGRRDEVFLVTKVLPMHATFGGTIAACRASLKRLRTDRIDLYLLHWRGRVPLEETVAAFLELGRSGLIRHWGVSNFDTADMMQLVNIPGGAAVQANQVLYNLMRRGPEYDLLPWCFEREIPIMAYSPIEQGRLLSQPAVRGVAERHGVSAAQIALAWVLRLDGLNAVPKAGSRRHVRENRAALGIQLTEGDLTELDLGFPPPTRKRPLEML